jgi:hypothetical protein
MFDGKIAVLDLLVILKNTENKKMLAWVSG